MPFSNLPTSWFTYSFHIKQLPFAKPWMKCPGPGFWPRGPRHPLTTNLLPNRAATTEQDADEKRQTTRVLAWASGLPPWLVLYATSCVPSSAVLVSIATASNVPLRGTGIRTIYSPFANFLDVTYERPHFHYSCEDREELPKADLTVGLRAAHSLLRNWAETLPTLPLPSLPSESEPAPAIL